MTTTFTCSECGAHDHVPHCSSYVVHGDEDDDEDDEDDEDDDE